MRAKTIISHIGLDSIGLNGPVIVTVARTTNGAITHLHHYIHYVYYNTQQPVAFILIRQYKEAAHNFLLIYAEVR